MSKKGSLFLLVKSLTPGEKRYFKRYTAGGSETNYMRLFDAIDRQEEFDGEALRLTFKGEAFVNQLHVAKIYLADLIMKALRNYYAGESITSQILDLVRDTEILYRKELYEAAGQKIEKACKLAEKYEKTTLMPELTAWKRKLMISSPQPEGNTADFILQTERDTLDRLNDLHSYWQKTHHLFNIVQEQQFTEQIDISRASTLQALILHRHLMSSHYFITNQPAKAEEEISLLLERLETEPHRIEDEPGSYVTAIGNKIGMLLSQKRWEETEALIAQMRSVPARYKLASESKFTVRLWLRIYNLELEVYRDTRQLDKGTALAEQVAAYLKSRAGMIPDHYRIMLCYQVASLYFLQRDFSKALQWINGIININFGDTRIDLQCYARIMNLMIHFELNNIMVLRYAVESCRRFFKKKKSFNAFEQCTLLLFSRLSLAEPAEYKEIFRSASGEDYTENIQDYIDMKGWLKHKLEET